MKKVKLLALTVVLMLLSGCSFIGEVNETIDYVGAATSHIEQLNAFAEEAPQLIQEAANNPEVQQELETQLVTLKQEIEAFINISDIPAVAEGIHNELVTKNEALLAEINKALENGQLALDQLENSEIITTIHNVTELLNQIENLGQ